MEINEVVTYKMITDKILEAILEFAPKYELTGRELVITRKECIKRYECVD